MFLKSGQDEASPPLPSFEFAAETILSSFFQRQFPLSGGRSHAKVHRDGTVAMGHLWGCRGANPARFLLLPQPSLLWQPTSGWTRPRQKEEGRTTGPLEHATTKQNKNKKVRREPSPCAFLLTTVGRGILPLVLNNSFKKLFRNKANT